MGSPKKSKAKARTPASTIESRCRLMMEADPTVALLLDAVALVPPPELTAAMNYLMEGLAETVDADPDAIIPPIPVESLFGKSGYAFRLLSAFIGVPAVAALNAMTTLRDSIEGEVTALKASRAVIAAGVQ